MERVFAGLIMVSTFYFKLRTRIYAGYIITGGIALLMVLLAYFSVMSLFGEFKHFTEHGESALRGQELSRNVVELQRSADLFMQDGQVSGARQTAYISERVQRILLQLEQGGQPEVQERVESIRQHLNIYTSTFEDVKRQRQRRAELVEQRIADHASEVNRLLQAYRRLQSNGRAAPVDQLAELETALLRVEQGASRYFYTLDGRYITRMQQWMRESRQLMSGFALLEIRPEAQALLDAMLQSLQNYEAVILEAVQRTRGYMYLVNVVMAAEADEMLYQTQYLADLIQAEMKNIEEQAVAEMRWTGQWVLWICLGLLVLVLLLSYLIGHSVADPIRSLAKTFMDLARGKDSTSIERQDADDELGELARAAEVFRSKNQETRQLLASFQALSSELEQKVADRTQELEQANARLEALSNTDSLTGLANRRLFDQVLEREWARVERSGEPLAAIMMDVDYFKLYNDHYGHLAGDDCLKAIADELQLQLKRATDLAARYGGEEFVMLLQNTDLEGALRVAESIRQAVEQLHLPHVESPMGQVSLSLGVALHTRDCPAQDRHWLVRQADEALYCAKEGGRNRVCAWPQVGIIGRSESSSGRSDH